MELFGTDGVRGIPGQFPLERAFLERFGEAAARTLREQGCTEGPILLARDTRASGLWITKALAKGFARAGFRELLDLGVFPTPGMAPLLPARKAAFGVVVSASHNPSEFNGIKFIDRRGMKLAPEVERAIEAALSRKGGAVRPVRVSMKRDSDAGAEYLDFLLSTFPPDHDLSGLKVVVDAAHGAASHLVGPLLKRLGAEVKVLGDRPNGRNINTGCGAQEPAAMIRVVRAWKADCGFSLDGDADRVIFADEEGRILNGDALIGMAAQHLMETGGIGRPKIAVTVMSNAGLDRFLESRSIGVERVPVGDRNVSAALEEDGLRLGGENSGHIILSRFSRAADGMLTALQVLAILKLSGRPLSHFSRSVQVYPQELTNLPVRKRVPLERCRGLQALLKKRTPELGGGRIFIRYSGTEPLLRILVEGPKARTVRRITQEIIGMCRKELNDHAS